MPEFQGAGGDHAADAAVAQAALDFAALAGKVAAAVAADGFGLAGRVRIGLLQIGEDQFGVQAGIGEDHRLQIVFQEFLGDAGGFVDVAAANAERAIHDRRIVEDESFLGGGRAVGVEHFDFRFEQARRRARRDWRWWPSSR